VQLRHFIVQRRDSRELKLFEADILCFLHNVLLHRGELLGSRSMMTLTS
jgi:hypothetical protein